MNFGKNLSQSSFSANDDKCSNCSTPNPYPSPIHLVGVSIIIVKISLCYYSTLHPLSIYAEKIQLPSPH